VAAFGAVTVKFFDAVAVPQLPPLEVKVNVTVPEYEAGGVYVAFSVVEFGEKVPPTPPSLHVPPVAEPPTVPPKAAEVPPAQIAVQAAPAFAVATQALSAIKIDPL
jgi:hypothetical protein